MKLIGITGGIGMGKSKASELLAQRGLPMIDTDVIARQIVEPGQPALAEIEKRFGKAVIGADRCLHRGELARIVFAEAAARRDLEDILHPRIREVWLSEAERWRKQGKTIGFVIIPLLFETNAASHFSATICVACSEKTQRERLRHRGWNDEQIRQRIEAQWPVEKKMLLSDFVVWTDTSIEIHAAQLDHLLTQWLR